MRNEQMIIQVQDMYAHLDQVYDTAGLLRDEFTDIDSITQQAYLKEHCNIIRQKIYELRELRGKFITAIKHIPQ